MDGIGQAGMLRNIVLSKRSEEDFKQALFLRQFFQNFEAFKAFLQAFSGTIFPGCPVIELTFLILHMVLNK